MPWTTEQKIFIVEAYFQQKSIHAAQLQFKERFRYLEFPVHSMIYRWVYRWVNTLWTTEIKDTTQRCCCQRLSCPQPKQVCASAKSGAWNQPGVATCPGAWEVLDSTWSTERGRQGPPVVPAG